MTQLEDPEVTFPIIGAAIAVHRQLGPGLLERVYDRALADECQRRGMPVRCQHQIEVMYNGRSVGRHFLDLLVRPFSGGPAIVVESKHFRCPDPARLGLARRQCQGYLAAARLRLGLVLNFGNQRLDVSRVVNPHHVRRSERTEPNATNGSRDDKQHTTTDR